MKKVIFGTSIIALLSFVGTASAAPTEHKTISKENCMSMCEEDCATMSMRDCMKMMKGKANGMSMKDCMKMMRNMQK
jgi:hypothetical protein